MLVGSPLGMETLKYSADTTLMTESKELKSLLMKVKEESKKASLLFLWEPPG